MSGDSDRCTFECSEAGGPVSCRTGRYTVEESLPDLVWLELGTQSIYVVCLPPLTARVFR